MYIDPNTPCKKCSKCHEVYPMWANWQGKNKDLCLECHDVIVEIERLKKVAELKAKVSPENKEKQNFKPNVVDWVEQYEKEGF